MSHAASTGSGASKLVLITGCSSGIGKALAQAFHARGHRVCATARRVDTLASLAQLGILTRPLDVTDAHSRNALLTELRGEGWQIGTLVNNAGYGAMGPLMDLPMPEWQRQFDVNVFAPVALIQAVLPDMVAQGHGHIVNISSVSGVMPTPFAGAYCASKAAVNALSDALRIELAPLGIRVTTVQPGGIESGFGDAAGQGVLVPAHSPYYRIRDAVMARAHGSQENATPAATFAAQLVDQLARANCPPVVRIGEKSRLMPALKKWLTDRQLDRILSKQFQLEQLKPSVPTDEVKKA